MSYPEFFGHTGKYICLSGNKCPLSPTTTTMVEDSNKNIFRILSILTGLKFTFHPGLWSFYKPCSRKLRLNIWALIPIQGYENTSGYDTVNGIFITIFIPSAPRYFFLSTFFNRDFWEKILENSKECNCDLRRIIFSFKNVFVSCAGVIYYALMKLRSNYQLY